MDRVGVKERVRLGVLLGTVRVGETVRDGDGDLLGTVCDGEALRELVGVRLGAVTVAVRDAEAVRLADTVLARDTLGLAIRDRLGDLLAVLEPVLDGLRVVVA